jgi:hypothetical protein
MESFEIKILRADGSVSLIVERKYLNSDAAIAAGKLMANGRQFEVWDRDDCLYDGSQRRDVSTASPRPAA